MYEKLGSVLRNVIGDSTLYPHAPALISSAPYTVSLPLFRLIITACDINCIQLLYLHTECANIRVIGSSALIIKVAFLYFKEAVTGTKHSVTVADGISAESLYDHYASISTDQDYSHPKLRSTCSVEN